MKTLLLGGIAIMILSFISVQMIPRVEVVGKPVQVMDGKARRRDRRKKVKK
jgi:hypothetical protein